MHLSSLRLPRFGSVIALIALFVALGGPAEAARVISGKDIKKNSITAKQVKKRSLKGTNLRKDSLTGREINESTLGSVPRAQVADRADRAASADNADMLGGTPAAGFVKPGSLAPGPVQTATLANGWTQESDSSPVGWYVDSAGLVHLQGAANGGTVSVTAFSLPAALRPAKRKGFAVACSGAAGYLQLYPDGSVVVANVGQINPVSGGGGGTVTTSSQCSAFVSFEGVSFRPGS